MPSDLIYREDAKDFVRHAYHKGLNPVEYLDEVPSAYVPQSAPKWISVKERLPENGKVLCVRKSEAFRGRRYIDILTADHGFFMNGAFVVSDGNVTHWMPLPEPPKEGGGIDGC